MDKELLFKEIRRQRVLLWAGAGFSLYAGYPLGKGVVKKLYDELSSEQQRRLAENLGQEVPSCPIHLPLPEFAQYFVTLNNNNRDTLIEVITSIFSADPTDLHVHEQLATLAYIDYIVTTNYDTMFERAYGTANLHVVTEADNVPQIDKKPVTLFKIHGELTRPRTLIVTKNDYQNFFERADKLVWTNLKALMSKRTIVFVGYAVEDPNILDAFVSVYDNLRELMRPAYVVGPSMPSIKQDELRAKNIHFIQMSGEEFVREFLEDTKKKALNELKDNSQTHFKPIAQTLRNLGLKFDIHVNGEEFSIDNLRRVEGKTKREFIFNDESLELNEALQSLRSGESLKPVKIDRGRIHQVTQLVEGFVLPQNGITALWITRAPGWHKTVDVRLGSGFTIPSVEIIIYRRSGGISIVALTSYARAEITVNSNKSDSYMSIKVKLEPRREMYANSLAMLEHAYLMHAIDSRHEFSLIEKGVIIWTSESDTLRLESNRNKRQSVEIIPADSSEIVGIAQGFSLIERTFKFSMQNIAVEEYVVNDVMHLNDILSMRQHVEKTKDSVDFVLNEPNSTLETIGINKTKSTKEDVPAESSFTEEFFVFGWTLRLTWIETITVVQAVCKRVGEKEYILKSKIGRIIHQTKSITSAEVVSSPVWVEPRKLSLEEIMQEKHPRY